MLFVSHNMQAIRQSLQHCDPARAGKIVRSGEAGEVVVDYLAQEANASASATWEPGQGPGDEDFRLLSVQVLNSSGEVSNLVNTAEPFRVRMEFDLFRADEALCVGFDLATSDGAVLLRSYQTDLEPERWPKLANGRHTLECTIPAGLLNDGRYLISPRVSLHCVRWIVHTDAAVSFDAHLDHAVSPYAQFVRPGTIAPVLEWSLLE